MGRTQSGVLTAVAFNNAGCVGSQALPSAKRGKKVGFGFALNINNYILSPGGRANDGANGFPLLAHEVVSYASPRIICMGSSSPGSGKHMRHELQLAQTRVSDYPMYGFPSSSLSRKWLQSVM